MHETLRRRIMRKLETLPEAQLYQVLDYIEFLESRYTSEEPADATGLQRWAEKLEDGLRKRTMNPSNLREAFQLLAAADRALSSVQEVGRQIVDELQWEEGERPRPPASPGSSAGSRPGSVPRTPSPEGDRGPGRGRSPGSDRTSSSDRSPDSESTSPPPSRDEG